MSRTAIRQSKPSTEPHALDKGLPEDWDLHAVGKMGEVIAGKALAASGPGEQRPYLRTKNVFDGLIKVADVLTMPMTDAEFVRYGLRRGDVLLNEGQSLELVGRCAQYNDEFRAPCAIQNQLIRFRTNGNVDSGFATHLFRYCQQSGVFSRIALQTTSIAHLGVSRFSTLVLGWPNDKSEQCAIAKALSDADELINALKKLITKKRAIKQATMQQLLTGKTRLPGFSGEWGLMRLGDHVSFLSHGTHSRAELLPDGPIKNLHYGDIHASTSVMLEPKSLPGLPVQKAKGYDRLQDGDLVFVDASEDLAGVSKSVEIHDVGQTELVAGLHTISARFNKEVLADGFKAYLQFCPVFAQHLRRLAYGTKVYATNRSHIASIEMRLPDTEEQAAIVTILSDMNTEIESLERRLNKTRQIKQGMMQQLLTGRIRLVESDVQTTMDEGKDTGSSTSPHSKAFNEAVVISTLAKHFGKEDYPLGRKRYTKLSYLLHRHAEGRAEGYLKKAAGPYNPRTRYGGSERIALENGYIREHKKGPYAGFVASDNVSEADAYFTKWYGSDALKWLNQFRYRKNDDLELLSTVDMAAEELRVDDKVVDVSGIKHVIRTHPEWKAKLDREVFSDSNIAKAIAETGSLFGDAHRVKNEERSRC